MLSWSICALFRNVRDACSVLWCARNLFPIRRPGTNCKRGRVRTTSVRSDICQAVLFVRLSFEEPLLYKSALCRSSTAFPPVVCPNLYDFNLQPSLDRSVLLHFRGIVFQLAYSFQKPYSRRAQVVSVFYKQEQFFSAFFVRIR